MMDKMRKRLLVILMLIFAITIVGFIMTLFGNDGDQTLSGAAVSGEGSVGKTLLSVAVPGILFMGFLILSVVCLEKKK